MGLKSKWDAKTAELVHRICRGKKGVCFGLALLFLDVNAPEEEMFQFVIELAQDPDNPIPPDERERLTACFEYIMIGVRKLYEEGIPPDAPPTYNKNLH